jgi:peptide deformylase
MKIKKVVLDPDPRLRLPNVNVTAPWADLETDVKRMFKVMYSTGVGCGLAAPQVGWNVRLFIMNPDIATKKPRAQRVFWNPDVDLLGEPAPRREGCLSLPNVYGNVMRYPEVKLYAQSPTGPVEEVFSGLAAQIIQHEMDHLAGLLCFEKFVKEAS